MKLIFPFSKKAGARLGEGEEDPELRDTVTDANETPGNNTLRHTLPGGNPFPAGGGSLRSGRAMATLLPKALQSPQSPRTAIFNATPAKELSSSQAGILVDKSMHSLASTQLNNPLVSFGGSAHDITAHEPNKATIPHLPL